MIFDIIAGTSVGASPIFNDPGALFASGEQGAWYDMSDLSSMFQDSAGTIPVTVSGDPVGKILDKSGNNHHATQTIANKRPLYRTAGGIHWLEYDGTDDEIVTSFNPSSVASLSSAFYGVGLTSTRSLYARNPVSNGYFLGASAGESAAAQGYSGNPTYRVDRVPIAGAPVSLGAISTALGQTGLKRVASVNSLDLQGWPGFSIGGFSAYQVVGNIYSIIIRGRTSTTQEIIDTETWIASKMGITLP